ncbi:hypothetical protein PMAYCL1PPCAC_30480, partial [Pristionchus mayeri]
QVVHSSSNLFFGCFFVLFVRILPSITSSPSATASPTREDKRTPALKEFRVSSSDDLLFRSPTADSASELRRHSEVDRRRRGRSVEVSLFSPEEKGAKRSRRAMSSIDMSDGADIPSDESLSVSFSSTSTAPPMSSHHSGLSAQGRIVSTASVEALFTGLGRDIELNRKYPEFFRQITAKRDSIEARSDRPLQESDIIPQTSEGRLLRDAIEICRDLRRCERVLREKERDFNLLQSQNREIRETYVKIYAKAEQEEEYISNILLKRIQKLKNDKETLAQKYEQEEEYLTNDLMRRIQQLQSERDSLEGKMKTEQGQLIDNLLSTIRRMETEMGNSRKNMDRMRKEKIDQENQLENEQELLFNTLGKQMDQLNNEKRKMQAMLSKAYEMGFLDSMATDVVDSIDKGVHGGITFTDAPMPERPPSVSGMTQPGDVSPTPKVSRLHHEVNRLRTQLRSKDLIIAELQTKLENKDAQLREAMASTSETKFVSAIMEATQKYMAEKSSDRVSEMGPPSVPSVVYSEGADMDDSSSRGSFHSDMDIRP